MNKAMVAFIAVLCIAGLAAFGAVAAAEPRAAVAFLQSKQVEGSVEDGAQSFKGIPYAAPPVGPLRWRPPQSPTPLPASFKARTFRPDCMQVPFESIVGTPIITQPSEDCLYLNIWRPDDMRADEKLPVIVWVHGGGFVNGGSSQDIYNGAAMARRGVVFVTFNYRLGRLGFFAHPALSDENDGPHGNYGVMDQIAALKWVKANIEAFGGDPDGVTVVGESAGGMSVLNLMVSPAARGLFHRAVVMSGGGRTISGFGGRHISENRNGLASAEEIGVNFARAIGIDGEGKAALDELRALPAKEILGDLNIRTLFVQNPLSPQFSGGPFVDGEIMTGEVEDQIGGEDAFNGPLIIGTTSADMGFAVAPTKPLLFATFGRYATEAEAAYDPAGNIGLKRLLDMVGADRTMHEPARYVARKHSAAGANVYNYRFHYVAKAVRDAWAGALHASEIPYFFGTVDIRYGDETTPQDLAAQRLAMGYLLNFAKMGSPNGAGLENWPSFRPRETLLTFTGEGGARAGADPWAERLDMVEAARTVSRDAQAINDKCDFVKRVETQQNNCPSQRP